MQSATDPSRPRLLTRLGWGHRGFRVHSAAGALLSLALIILIGFLIDQLSRQVGFRFYPDLQLWRHVAADYLADPDQALYRRHPEYVYPPFFLTLIRPLSDLPERSAGLVFQAFKWLAIGLSLHIAWRLSSPPKEDVPPVVALGSIVLAVRFFWNDISHGNINSFLLLAVLAGCWLVKRGRPYGAGALVGAAASVKLAPGLVLLYFLYKREWRPVVGAAVAAAVCLLAWPSLWIGWNNNWQTLAVWYQHVVADYMPGGEIWAVHINQSLPAIVNRLFGPAVAIYPDTRVTLVELSSGTRQTVRLILSAGILLALAWLCRGRLRNSGGNLPDGQPLAFAAEVALVQIAMLLMSGFSWKAHFVALLLPYCVLLAWLADARYAGPRRLVGGLLLASFALCTLTGDVLGPTTADYAEAYGLIALGAILAAVGVSIVRVRCRKGISSASPTACSHTAV